MARVILSDADTHFRLLSAAFRQRRAIQLGDDSDRLSFRSEESFRVEISIGTGIFAFRQRIRARPCFRMRERGAKLMGACGNPFEHNVPDALLRRMISSNHGTGFKK